MKKCRHCEADGAETFRYMNHRYVFDVDRARELVADGRTVYELDDADTRFFVHTSRIHWKHVPHVNPNIPGIVAHIFFTTDEGEFVRAQLLIDGHHRAARALDLQRPFPVRVLTEDESEAILLTAPAGGRRPAAPPKVQPARRRTSASKSRTVAKEAAT